MEMEISNRKNLILAADDFGASERANRNILFLISMGKIDRVAIMTNGQMTEKEIGELSQSGVKLDIHLDLTSKNNGEKTPIFHVRIGKFIWDYLFGKYASKKVELEWSEQIEKFKELFGKYPDGINSHEHIHFFPTFFKIILKLQEKYPIPYLRFATDSVLKAKSPVSLVLRTLRKISYKKFASSDFVSSNHLISLDWIENIEEFLDKPPMGSIEIVCHPHRAEEFVLTKDNF